MLRTSTAVSLTHCLTFLLNVQSKKRRKEVFWWKKAAPIPLRRSAFVSFVLISTCFVKSCLRIRGGQNLFQSDRRFGLGGEDTSIQTVYTMLRKDMMTFQLYRKLKEESTTVFIDVNPHLKTWQNSQKCFKISNKGEKTLLKYCK